MALQEKYKQYLVHPTADALAEDVSLNYVPTTTALTGSAAVLRHLNAQHQLVEKKNEQFLNIIEGVNSVCVETETTLHFALGGGTYLPGLDDNFITGRTVVLPITHIAIFNEDQKIKQIRLLWDQACLLKAVDTIGARGRNWPIRDGKDQVAMIASSAAVAPAAAPPAERSGRPQTRGKDPHSSLSLFENRTESHREESEPNLVAPRESAKPAPREFGEIFAGDEPVTSPERSVSPSKRDRENSNPLKAGAGKNYRESRLFDASDSPSTQTKGPSIKTDAKKFQHFEFGEPEFKVPATPASKVKSKHASQWDFADFVTPEKPPTRKMGHHQPNYDWQTDPGVPEAKEPVYLPHVPHARPDADPHFAFEDAATPKATRQDRPTSSSSRPDLYNDNVVGDGKDTESKDKTPLKNITNPNVHNKTFGSHWEMNDQKFQQQNENTQPALKGKNTRAMESHWSLYDDSPGKDEKPRGINIAGDGMGKRKTGEQNWWEPGW